jgi:hypothetical protein
MSDECAKVLCELIRMSGKENLLQGAFYYIVVNIFTNDYKEESHEDCHLRMDSVREKHSC